MKAFIGGAVRLGICDTDEQCKGYAEALAPQFESQVWKWATRPSRNVDEFRDNLRVPTSTEIYDAIRSLSNHVRKMETKEKWGMSGGIAIIGVASHFYIEVDNSLAPPLSTQEQL